MDKFVAVTLLYRTTLTMNRNSVVSWVFICFSILDKMEYERVAVQQQKVLAWGAVRPSCVRVR